MARRWRSNHPGTVRTVSLGSPPSRLALLAVLGALIGVSGGFAAYLVIHLVGLISNLALLHRVGFNLPDLRYYHPSLALLPVALAGGLVIVAVSTWAPIITGHGIPESLEAILFRESRIQPRAAVAKPITAAIVMGTGGPFGAEGPIIVMGGAIGSLLGQLIPTSPAERRILLATGAAAGMAGVFSTPLAAIILAFELLTFERSLRALLPLVLATGIAAEIHILLISPRPLFAAVTNLTVSGAQLPLFIVVGLAAGLLAVVLNKGLFAFERGFAKLPLPRRWHPVVGALGYALIGLAVPGSLSVGYWAITDNVNGRFVLAVAGALCVAKMLSWWIGLASNTSGGTLAPMFLIGASMGEVIGITCAHLFPGMHIEPGAFALVAMGVTFGVGARALLTGAVFALEVTGAYHLVVPMLIAIGIGELVVGQLLDERIMSDKLLRRGYRFDFDTSADPLRLRVVGTVMNRETPRARTETANRDGARLDLSTEQDGEHDREQAAPRAPSTSGTSPTGEPPGEGEGTQVRLGPLSFLSDALADLLAAPESELVVYDGDRVVGTVNRETLATEFRRRIAENTVQAPNLHLSLKALRRTGRPRPIAAGRTTSARADPSLSPPQSRASDEPPPSADNGQR